MLTQLHLFLEGETSITSNAGALVNTVAGKNDSDNSLDVIKATKEQEKHIEYKKEATKLYYIFKW